MLDIKEISAKVQAKERIIYYTKQCQTYTHEYLKMNWRKFEEIASRSEETSAQFDDNFIQNELARLEQLVH